MAYKMIQPFTITIDHNGYQWLKPHEAELRQLLEQAEQQHMPQQAVMHALKNQQQNYHSFMQNYQTQAPLSRWFQKILLKHNSLMLFLINKQIPIHLKKSIIKKSRSAFKKIDNSTIISILPLFIGFAFLSAHNEAWQLMLGPLLLMFIVCTTSVMSLVEGYRDWQAYLVESSHAMRHHYQTTTKGSVQQFIDLAQLNNHQQTMEMLLWQQAQKRKQQATHHHHEPPTSS